MKDVRLSVHVAVKTLNLEISRCLADFDKELYLGASPTCSTPVYFLICPIRSLFYIVIVAVAKEYEKPSVPRILSRAKQGSSGRLFREQCWRSGESNWPSTNVVLYASLRAFSPGTPIFLSHQKPTFELI